MSTILTFGIAAGSVSALAGFAMVGRTVVSMIRK